MLLAHSVDGGAIPPDHGYPLRLVVPGFIGVRNCKWVCKLEISDEEMQARLAKWEKPAPRYTRGVLAKFAATAASASEGAVTDKYL